MKITFLVILFLGCATAYGAELGYTRSQSSTTYSNKFKAAFNLDQTKFSTSYSSGKNTSGTVTDDQTSSLKLSGRYRFQDSTSLTLDYKKTDESYFFEGNSVGLRLSAKIFEFGDGSQATSSTRLNLGVEGSQKKYIKANDENLTSRTVSLGLDQDLGESFSVGFEYSVFNYESTSLQTKSALTGTTVASDDINNYISGLSKNSASAFVEYANNWILIGAGYGVDSPQTTSGSRYNSVDIYLDLYLTKSWTLSGSFSRGKSDSSTSLTDSTSAGLSYRF